MIRRLALALALLLLLAFGAWKQQDAPLEVRCGSTSGGVGWTATGARWAQGLGGWLHEVADHPEQYRDEKAVQRVLDGVAKQLWYWTMAFIDPLRGQKIDPQILELERRAEQDAAAAEDACAPCPTAPDSGSEPEFDPKTLSLAASGKPEARGEKAVWLALRAAGFSPVHAAGVMGNMQAESGFDPQIVQGGGHSTRPSAAGSGGYGLVQWTPGRKLSDYIGSDTPTIANQVATLKAQLAGKGPHPEKAAGDAFWAARDVNSAAVTFHLRYERSASKDSSARVRNAQRIHSRWQSSGGAVEPPTSEPETHCLTADQEEKGTAMVDAAGSRRIKEPTSGTTYSIPIPKGPRGVAINFALDQVADGDWYRFGSHGPDTWDCSGLVSAAWAKAGVRFTPQTEAMLREIPKTTSPQPGDLTYKYGHTQMILGKINGQNLIVEAPRTGSRMRIRPQWMTPTAILDPTKMEQPI